MGKKQSLNPVVIVSIIYNTPFILVFVLLILVGSNESALHQLKNIPTQVLHALGNPPDSTTHDTSMLPAHHSEGHDVLSIR